VDVTGEWKQLLNEEFHHLSSLPNVVDEIKEDTAR
jgi:hypothetical protein